MKIIENRILCKGKNTVFNLYAIGDVHIGAVNCAEREFISLVQKIEQDPHALWVGGGDYTDAVILSDLKRFDVNTLPNWMLVGTPGTIKERIGDILYAQRQRFLNLVAPIKEKCLGLIEGNHEYSIFKYHNRDHLSELCRQLDTPNLTDCAFVRLNFYGCYGKNASNVGNAITCTIFVCHGHGGGRTPGAEPNKLVRLAMDKDADVVLTGHTHTFDIIPPIVMLGVNRTGKLAEEPIVHEKHVANWGSFLHTYKVGPSTYASRDNYPVRPMYTVKTTIDPFHTNRTKEYIKVEMNRIKL